MSRLILATVCFLAAAIAAPAADRVRPITFDKVKFEMKQGDPFEPSLSAEDIKKLDGKTVRVSGWMLPSFQQSGIKQFILVRDNQECCFGPKAALYDCMVVEMTGGATAEFSTYQITVGGVFKVQEVKGPDGRHLAIYHLDAHSVK